MPAKKVVQNDDKDDKKVKRTQSSPARSSGGEVSTQKKDDKKSKTVKDTKAKAVKVADSQKETKPKKTKVKFETTETKEAEAVYKDKFKSKDSQTEEKPEEPKDAKLNSEDQNNNIDATMPDQSQQNTAAQASTQDNSSQASVNQTQDTKNETPVAISPANPVQDAQIVQTTAAPSWPTTTFENQNQPVQSKPQTNTQIPSWLSGGFNPQNPNPTVPPVPPKVDVQQSQIINPPPAQSQVQPQVQIAQPVNPFTAAPQTFNQTQAQPQVQPQAQTITPQVPPQPLAQNPQMPNQAAANGNLPSWLNPNPPITNPAQAPQANQVFPQNNPQFQQDSQAQNLGQSPVNPMPNAMPSPAGGIAQTQGLQNMTNPLSGARPQMSQSPAAGAQAAPQKPYKPMTLNDLAAQTPIFKIEDLDFSKKRRKELREQRKAEEPKSADQIQQVIPNPEQNKTVSEPKKEEIVKAVPPIQEPVQPKEEDKKQEVLEAEVLSSKTEDNKIPKIEDEPSFLAEMKEKINEALKESNINKGHIMGCIGGIVLLLVAIFLIITAIKWIFSSDFNLGSLINDTEQTSDDTITKDPDNETPQDNSNPDLRFVDPSIYSGIIAPTLKSQTKPNKVNNGTVDSSLQSGIISSMTNFNLGGSLFVESVEYLKYMKSIYYVDIRAKLNASDNPTTDLNKYMSDLDKSIEKGKYFLDKATSMKNSVKDKFDATSTDKDNYEGIFFDSVNKFDGKNAENALKSFAEVKSTQVDLKSQYKAWSLVEAYYTKYLAAFQTRLTDIQYNQEALVKGVQVYKIDNSPGLDLIVDVGEGL